MKILYQSSTITYDTETEHRSSSDGRKRGFRKVKYASNSSSLRPLPDQPLQFVDYAYDDGQNGAGDQESNPLGGRVCDEECRRHVAEDLVN